MTAKAKPTFGTSLKMGPSGGSLTAVSKLVTLAPPQRERSAEDATTHGSAGGAMEFIADGVFNPGVLTGSINYIAGDADDDLFLAAFASGDLYTFEWTANAATGKEEFSCDGVLISYGPDELPVRGKQTASFTIQLSGATTQAPAA